jgi:uncharacterized protein YjbI with pentapeptide repeats
VANPEHEAILKQGVERWNAWRHDNPTVRPDLSRVYLRGANLLNGVYLSGANLYWTDLQGAGLSCANLSGTVLSWTDLSNADLSSATLSHADLSCAFLGHANLTHADLTGANFTNAMLVNTVFADVDLNSVTGLETCTFIGPSIIDHRTLQKSKGLPRQVLREFLRRAGLPEDLIEPSLSIQPNRYYSCFISYSAKDEDVAKRIYADLQNIGVECYYAPHDMPIGGKLLDEIDAAIRRREKLLLILSEQSIKSGWVEDEVTKAYAEERKRGQTVLFPIRIDDEVFTTEEAWATKLRDGRNIGDFRRWKDHDAYKQSFERVVRDLTVKSPVP